MATRRKTAPADKDMAATDPKGVKPRKPAARKPATTAKAVHSAGEPTASPDAAQAPGATGLWRAGLKALDTVRQDVTRRHTNVIETLLGIAPARTDTDSKPSARSFPGLEGLGLRKFEDVFDQRVATALERLGMPTREEVQALRTQLDQVLARLDRLEAGAPAAAPRKTTRSPQAGSKKR